MRDERHRRTLRWRSFRQRGRHRPRHLGDDEDAKRAIAAVNEGDMLTTQMAVLKRFGKRAPVDTIALRRRVAAAVQSQDRYCFEGR